MTKIQAQPTDAQCELILSGLAFWNDDVKRTSLVRRTGNGNIALVGAGNSPGKTKTQAGAGLGSAGVTAIKAFKNVGKISF